MLIQLYRVDAEFGEVVDDAGGGEGGEVAAFSHSQVRADGEAADVGFVDNRVAVGGRGRAVAAPLEQVGADDGLGYGGGAVATVEGQVGAGGATPLRRSRLPAMTSGEKRADQAVNTAFRLALGRITAVTLTVSGL
jgi:hypothetical protein